MKKLTIVAIVAALILIGTASANLFAQSTQDTVYIPGAQSLEISNIINADTAVTDFRVYVLDRGAVYFMERAFQINSSVKFMATGDENARPPVLAPAIRADDSSEEWVFQFTTPGISVELEDLYILWIRSDLNSPGWTRGMHIGADNISVKVRRVVFDGFTEVAIRVEGGQNVKLDVQDSHFRNLIHSSAFFGGQGFLAQGFNYPDTTIFINNTFFSVNAYIFDVRGLGPHNVFEHNTVVYGVVNPMLIRQADNLYIRNNLFYASHAYGGDPRWMGSLFPYPDSTASGIYKIRKGGDVWHGIPPAPGPEAWNNEDLGLVFDPNQWTHQAENNVYHFPGALMDFYNNYNDTVTVADSITTFSGSRQLLTRRLNNPAWIGPYSQSVLDTVMDQNHPLYSPYVKHENNIDSDPGFTDQGVLAHLDELIAYINKIVNDSFDEPWYYEMNFPPAWPLPESFVYTNADLMSYSTGGFPVGDLNWFPDKKAEWITNVRNNDRSFIPDDYSLSNAYPNPFNPQTNIDFKLAQSSQVRITVYNVLGQQVKVLVNEELAPGSYTVTWNGTNESGIQVPSGMYLYRLEAGSFSQTKKVVFLK
jgi:hypothetical protein